jgi:hypothetical protein
MMKAVMRELAQARRPCSRLPLFEFLRTEPATRRTAASLRFNQKI